MSLELPARYQRLSWYHVSHGMFEWENALNEVSFSVGGRPVEADLATFLREGLSSSNYPVHLPLDH